ncbi:lysophospholipid acyltransferase family protein [Marinifilum caeruleilacunae]|uniref:1-acyl-sn-glycerol-3-phosphate acyltransferase n=1 Tax=Marinifilum caeruleilacunae TaxID=2499076 RepID=A0ABX1WV15_9BACT|nr:lysophospholipid acyltransferase family protein [Marinifilum caeruleilacunae]NOU59954.1 1-acyl-sn-glycerol-3-phosphate acyltransferase [Marinifilum caeruleilacunae]
MTKILSYFLTTLFYILFFLLLVIFHPIQVICLKVFGYRAHKNSVDVLNFLLMRLVGILAVRITYEGKANFPKDRPLIIVSNHQGTYDIPPIVWLFRKYHPKFISKKELAKNIPSVSYNLRHSGAALIDRKNRAQAIPEIYKLGQLIAKNNYAACIFPEGTRSKTGKMKKFKSGGIETLLKAAPNALIVPFAVEGNYKIEKRGMFPLCIGQKVKYSILDPIETEGKSAIEITNEAEQLIRKKLNQL